MAGIFLSYAHQDRAVAAKVAAAFETAGHRVWWDLHIHAGKRFAEEIGAALDQADHIVVLWSRASVKSSWVLDEAAVGRDSDRLIPVRIDKTLPPMGFRQYQSLTLVGLSKRGGKLELEPLLDAIASGNRPDRDAPASPKRRPSVKAALIALALLVIVGAIWWFKPWAAHEESPTISIGAPSQSNDPLSRDFAHQVAVDLGRFPSGPLSSLAIQETSDPSDPSPTGAAYRAEIGLTRSEDNAHADISLFIKGRRGLAWATGIDGRADRLVDLRQQAAANLSDVLICALRTGPGGRQLPTDDVFRVFLSACAKTGSNLDDALAASAIEAFRQVTRKAPQFAPAWGNLAWLQSGYFYVAPADQQHALFLDAKASLARARQLDPNIVEGFAAESQLIPDDRRHWARTLSIIDRGLSVHPESAMLLTVRAERLADVGRATEAIEMRRRALDLEPLTLSLRTGLIDTLSQSGRMDAALAELARDDAIWPHSTDLQHTRYLIDLRYGDPANALRLLPIINSADTAARPYDQSWQTFLRARIDPSPANIEAALQSFRDRYRRDPADIPGYIQALGTFGRIDEAYQATRNPVTLDSMIASTEVLFRQHMRGFRADPRFIELANRLGLLAFWRDSGKWPDFCSDPELPYDCRAEAKKYPV